MTQLILASQSPRRKELLQGLGYSFLVDPSGSEEVFNDSLSLDEALLDVAKQKAAEVLKRHPEAVIVAADTIVADGGKILGKPKNRQEAFQVLKSLSNKSHEVKTGIVVCSSSHTLGHVETTTVHFRNLSDEEIEQYVSKGSCLDKAGSYGIQDVDFVDHIDGSYSNVVGLPLGVVDVLLKDIQRDPSVSI